MSYNQCDYKWCPISALSRIIDNNTGNITEKVGVILDESGQMRDVYDAVADPTRRKLLQLLANVEDLPLHEITVHFEMGRTAVSKHLAILKDADLVIARKVGRETRYRLNAKPLKEIQDWVSFYEGFWKENIIKLKLLLEEK